MSNNSEVGPAFIAGLLLGAIAGVFITACACETNKELDRNKAIEAGAAQYNSVTGEFEFKNFKVDEVEVSNE